MKLKEAMGYDPEMKQDFEIRKAYDSGMSAEEIAKKHKKELRHVHGALLRTGADAKGKRYKK
jgi:hypothetical protein